MIYICCGFCYENKFHLELSEYYYDYLWQLFPRYKKAYFEDPTEQDMEKNKDPALEADDDDDDDVSHTLSTLLDHFCQKVIPLFCPYLHCKVKHFFNLNAISASYFALINKLTSELAPPTNKTQEVSVDL